MNVNKTRVANKRVPKNVAAISTMNMSLNFEEEQAKWRFVANRRVAVEKMLSELVRAFVCNMTEDIDDPTSPNIQKATFGNFTFDFSPSLVNSFYGRTNSGETGYTL
ncbi:hypothetical protein LIER_03493 [Lithospermum erythrorhizon]|uniref:Uncharacterized protein n=1 Tax=Lithospermum erythrorhizon TaxID=34254 RepID=A0AAV3NV22_LITER